MRIKDNTVKFVHMKSGILKILSYVEDVYQEFGEEPVITSANDGKHMIGSKHYVGKALDFRTRYFDDKTIDLVVAELKLVLGSDYDIIKEYLHKHIEEQNYNGTLKDINKIK
jgi:cellobiose phosphorylase